MPRAVALLIVVAAGGCQSVAITPIALIHASEPLAERQDALDRWRGAIAIANEFLASSYRRTLPEGRFILDADGMRFETSAGTWPVSICCSTWGNWVVRTGFAAQEREWGFVVGERPPHGDPVLDNSWFRNGDAELVEPASMAKLLLHESTHMVYREGTVGFFNSIAYYAEAIFLLRSSKHSAERKPRATSEEFGYFHLIRTADSELMRTELERLHAEHLESGDADCEHGPFAEPPPAAPLPPPPGSAGVAPRR